MKVNNRKKSRNPNAQKEKILLALLPYWTPQIPPVGLACLKGFLQSHGYRVKAVDVNVDEKIRKIYNNYFDALRGYVSEEKRGNFYNIGHDVLQNHMMAHIHYQDEREYMELVKTIVYKTYYFNVNDEQVLELNKILDEFFAFLETYLTRLLTAEKPAYLGLSVYKGNLPASVFAFKLAREKFPGIKTVMGGAVFAQVLAVGTEDFDFFLKKTKNYIDYMIIGEGEELFLKLLQGELPAAKRAYTLADIDNKVLDLDSVNLPDFSDFTFEIYPNMASYSSRSCPFQCNFCTETVYWGKYRKKEPKQVVTELTTLYEKFGNRLFLLCDSLLNPIVTKLAQEFVNNDLSIYWDGYFRVDKNACNMENVYLWRQGGFYRARFGIESGSPRVLAAMNKDIPIEQIKTTLFNFANSGIKTTTYWIIGYPGETEEDFQKTLDLIEELRDDIYEAECNIFGYYLDGQVNSQEWQRSNKAVPVYPGNSRDLLMIQTRSLDCEPGREEVHRRLARCVDHCRKLGIPNPYSLYDICKADERWKKLHVNAVPSLVEFKDKNFHIDENRKIKKLFFIENSYRNDKGFNF